MGPLASQRQDHAAGQDEKQGAFSVLKGFFAGGFWGAVLGGATLTVASLASEQPAGNAPPATPQVTAPETAVDTTPDAPAEIAPVAPPQRSYPHLWRSTHLMQHRMRPSQL